MTINYKSFSKCCGVLYIKKRELYTNREIKKLLEKPNKIDKTIQYLQPLFALVGAHLLQGHAVHQLKDNNFPTVQYSPVQSRNQLYVKTLSAIAALARP